MVVELVLEDVDGTDIHVDTDIGKRLSTLASTLTNLTEVADEDSPNETQGPVFDILDGMNGVSSDKTT